MQTGCNFDIYSTGEVVALYIELSYILIPYLNEEDIGYGDNKSDYMDSDAADLYSVDGVQEICISFVCVL